MHSAVSSAVRSAMIMLSLVLDCVEGKDADKLHKPPSRVDGVEYRRNSFD